MSAVVEYSQQFQARAAEELSLLPEGAATAEILADYALMREQARAVLQLVPEQGVDP